MRILIIDQCSKRKDFPNNITTFGAEEVDEHSLQDLQAQENVPTKKARNVYTGRQQHYVNQAVDRLRSAGDAVDRYFISAGFGVVEEKERLPPYDVTFTDYTKEEIGARGEKLSIETDIIGLLEREYDLVFFTLGGDYLESFDLERVLNEAPDETWFVCFNHDSTTEAFDNAVSLSARTTEAKEHETIVIALKGRYLQYFAGHRSQGKNVTTRDDIIEYLSTKPTNQTRFGEFGN